MVTDTFAVPAEAMSLAGRAAVSSVEFTHEVDSAVPFHSAVAPFSKFEPYRVRVSAAAPAVALEGAIEASVGGV